MGIVTIGVDVGQRRDPSAIAVFEAERDFIDGRAQCCHTLRHVERLALGMPYPQVATRIAAIVASVGKRMADGDRSRITLYVDATGVGKPIVDQLTHMGLRPHGVWFVHGDTRVMRPNGDVSLGKAYLARQLAGLTRAGLLRLPRTAEAAALAAELMVYERRVSADGKDTYGAFKTNTHDDLATAVGLAVQWPPYV